MKLIIARHGETEENAKGIAQGHLPGKLNANGIKQAKQLALRLKDEKIDAIYSSDLARAADTARIVAKYHPNTKIEFVQDLRERDMGDFSGKPKIEDWIKKILANAETLDHQQKRVKGFLDKVYQKHKYETVLFVAHGGTNLSLISAVLGKPPEYIKQLDQQKSTAVNMIEINEKDNKIVCLNCDKHLNIQILYFFCMSFYELTSWLYLVSH